MSLTRKKAAKIVKEYIILTLATIPMIVGVYVFKFPNNFTFAGVTGISVLLVKILPFTLTASQYNLIFNIILLVVAFLLLGKSFGIKTVYVTLLSSLGMRAMDFLFPMSQPLTNAPVIELVYAILLPAISTAILFNYGASAGGTEIIAMIFKKYSSWNIGVALFVVDFFVTFGCFFVYGVTTGLYSFCGLIAKSFVINGVLESINLCKSFTIVCRNPEPICEFIQNELYRTATKYDAEGTYTGEHKTVLLAIMNRGEAIRLRNFIKENEPDAFMMITNSSEVIGRDFHVYN